MLKGNQLIALGEPKRVKFSNKGYLFFERLHKSI